MSIESEGLKVNLVPGSWVDREDEWVVKFNIKDEEAIISLETFCTIALHYLSGGMSGWQGKTPKEVDRVMVELFKVMWNEYYDEDLRFRLKKGFKVCPHS